MSSCFLQQPSNGVIVNRPSTCGLAPHSRLFGGLWDVGRVPRGVRITHRLHRPHASRSNMRCSHRLWRIRIGRCPWKCPMVLTGGHGHEQVHPWSYSKVLTGEYGCSSGIVHNIIIEASVRLDYSPHYYIGQLHGCQCPTRLSAPPSSSMTMVARLSRGGWRQPVLSTSNASR